MQDGRAHPEAHSVEQMGQKAAQEQSGSLRTVRSEPSIPHRREHEKPWQKICPQSEAQRRNRIARRYPEEGARKQIDECERDANRIVRWHGDRQFVMDWRHLGNVMMKELPTRHIRKPAARQTRRQKCNEPKLKGGDTEYVHGDGG